MGNGFSGEASGEENKKIVKWLIDCGFVYEVDLNQPVGDFIIELHQSQHIVQYLLESFLQRKNAKGAIGASTNANIRIMVEILGIWKQTHPGKAIPNLTTRQLLRLSCLVE